jgi:DNA topoisomerase-1
MAPAIFDTLRVDITAADFLFRANGSLLKFQGFYAVWPRDDEGTMLPSLATGDMLDLHKLDPKQHFTQPPPRFSEATLVKELEERGIGRPSTYVPIISTIQDRGYVEQQERRFVPTWLGETVNELMVKHFNEIVDINFTAAMERRLDAIEEGQSRWTEFLQDFYERLKGTLQIAEKEMDRVQKPTEELGEPCPQCGKPLLVRMGRFGRFISCSGFPECDYRRSFVQKTGAICPQCGGDLVERKSRGRGKIFFGCANYPTCNFATWNRPLPLPCPECHGLLTQANGAKEAICQGCGAVVEGIAEGTPVVTGHRAVGAAANGDRPKRASRSVKKPAEAASSANGARKRTTAASTVARSRTATAHTTKNRKNGSTTVAPAKPRARRRISEIAGVPHEDA